MLISSPAILGIDEHENFRGQINAGLPKHLVAEPDKNISNFLLKVWERRFLKQHYSDWKTRTIFRSLEMAYQASTMPSENNSTIYDYGSKISIWVSSLEILSHPPKNNASLQTVINILENYSWKDKRLKRKNYLLEYRGKKNRVTIVSKLYKELYDARNDFLHGNSVKINRLYPFKKKNKNPLNHFAPLIYKVALLSYSDVFKDKRRKITTENLASEFSSEWNLVNAIIQAKTKK